MTQDVGPSNCFAIAYVVQFQKIVEIPGLYELDCQSSTRRQGCHCWELQDESFAFFGRIGIACRNLLNRVFNTHLINFQLRATKQEWKSAQKIEVICLSRHSRQCILHVSENALQAVEAFKYLRVVFTSDGSRNKGIDTWISKANAALHRGESNQKV